MVKKGPRFNVVGRLPQRGFGRDWGVPSDNWMTGLFVFSIFGLIPEITPLDNTLGATRLVASSASIGALVALSAMLVAQRTSSWSGATTAGKWSSVVVAALSGALLGVALGGIINRSLGNEQETVMWIHALDASCTRKGFCVVEFQRQGKVERLETNREIVDPIRGQQISLSLRAGGLGYPFVTQLQVNEHVWRTPDSYPKGIGYVARTLILPMGLVLVAAYACFLAYWRLSGWLGNRPRAARASPDPITEAQTLEAYGRKQEAIAVLRNALQADPDNEELLRELRRLETTSDKQ